MYLATDFVEIGYHPDMFLEDLFNGQCPRCKSGGFWSVKERHPAASDVGLLVVRRPGGVRRTQLWKNELYSAPKRP